MYMVLYQIYSMLYNQKSLLRGVMMYDNLPVSKLWETANFTIIKDTRVASF